MALLNVIKYGHPVLRQLAESYRPGEITQQFVEDMIETMKTRDGVGLAATQVGVAKQFIVASDTDKLYTLVNPRIVAFSETIEEEVEGCLSIPGVQAKVARPQRVIVKAVTVEGADIEIKANGLLARVFVHEIDHLNGVLYIDRAEQSSLEWIEGGEGKNRPITLAEIQTYYKQLYHQDRQELVFDPQVEIKFV